MKFRTLQDNLRRALWGRIAAGELTGIHLAEQTGFKQAHISNFLNRKRGLSVEGMDKLNTSLENTTGSFVTMASLDSGKFVLHVTQTFNNAFEKGNKWEELLGVLDAATGFENAKILLKKL